MAMNYLEIKKIDETALDVEWLRQNAIAIKFGKHFAWCKKLEMQAEENVKIIKAQLIQKANNAPDRHLGVGIKPTGPNVEAFYRNHPDHKKAKQEWIDAVYEREMAEIAKWEASNGRKTILENLVRLHGQQYFAGPSVPRDLSKEWEAKEKQMAANRSVKRKTTPLKQQKNEENEE